MRATRSAALISVLAVLLAACSSVEKTAATPDAAAQAVVAAADRSPADRKTDERRKPAELLTFSGVKPGMRVLDIGAGGGYGAELLARAVGPNGKVWGQNSQEMIDKFVKTAFDDRAAAFKGTKLQKFVSPFDDPVPPEAAPLDLVTIHLIYHDIAYLPVDRPKMLFRLYAALRSGGVVVITDHAAKVGEGISVAKSLHRIEEATVIQEMAAAGFRLVASADAWRNPQDPRTEVFFNMKTMHTDQFALRFVK